MLSRHSAADSGKFKKSESLLQHLKSSRSSSSEGGNGSQTGTLSTFNHTEDKKPKLALYEVNSFNKFLFCSIKHVKMVDFVGRTYDKYFLSNVRGLLN